MRQTITAVSALLIVVIVTGCWNKPRPLDPAAIQCARFDIGGIGYAMQKPKGSSIERSVDGRQVNITPNPGGRLVHYLWLGWHGAPTLEPPATTYSFSSDNRVEYTTVKDLGGGSGGTEGEIYGEFFFADHSALVFGCRDQKEGTPDPEWCVAYLETLHRQDQAGACQ